MSTSRTVRRVGLLGTVALAAAALTGCGAGFNAQTLQPYQAAEGTNATSGSIALRNVLVLADDRGNGKLYAAIVNTGSDDDRLTAIRSEDSEVKVTGMRPITLPPNQLVQLPSTAATPTPGTTGSGSRATTVEVTGAEPGAMVRLTFVFGKAAPITDTFPVLTTDHYSPTPRAVPTESPSDAQGGGHG